MLSCLLAFKCYNFSSVHLEIDKEWINFSQHVFRTKCCPSSSSKSIMPPLLSQIFGRRFWYVKPKHSDQRLFTSHWIVRIVIGARACQSCSLLIHCIPFWQVPRAPQQMQVFHSETTRYCQLRKSFSTRCYR